MAEAENQKKILIAEDERAIASILALKLNHAGYNAETAPDGEAALEMLKAKTYDLILLDLIMPKKDGFSVLEELKKRGTTTPVIVLSNLGQERDVSRAKELGAIDFFIKSNTPLIDIAERVQKVFESLKA